MTGGIEPVPRESRLAAGLAEAGVVVAGLRWGPGGAIAAATLKPWAEEFLRAAVAEWPANKGPVIADAAETEARRIRPTITADEVWEALVGDDDRRALMVRVLEAARRTGREDKLRWLGAILGRVAAEPEHLDEAGVLAAALDDLEAPHILVLAAIAEETPVEAKGYWAIERLADRLPFDDGIVRACAGTLDRHGLIREPPGFGGGPGAYQLTSLGRSVLDLTKLS